MQTIKKNTFRSKLLAWLLALAMVVTLTPGLTGIASAADNDTKLTVKYAGTEYKLTEGQWNTLVDDSTARVTDQYYSQYSNSSSDNPSNKGPYSGVKFSSILSTLGILDDMAGNFVVKIGGSNSTISYGDLTKARYLYSQEGTPGTYDADAAGTVVENIITDDGTFALGMENTRSEKNAPYFRTDVFESGITISNPAFELVEGDVTLDKDSYEYEGTAITPVVTVKHNNSDLTVNDDYTLSITGNEAVGEGTVTVTGKDQFYGTVVKKFAILSPADKNWYDAAKSSFTISNESQLRGFAEIVNGTAAGISQDSFAGKTVKLDGDISLAAPWAAAGTDSKPFEGTFDGQKHSITGLNINSATGGFKGLFGKIGEGGVVKNFSISGSIGSSGTFITSGSDNLGGVAGYNDGKVKNVTGSVSVFVNTSSIFAVGGIVGQNGDKGTVSECQNTANVTATKASGGVVGRNYGTIDKCVNNGDITGNGGGKDGIGGIVGYGGDKSGTYQNNITNCYNMGTISNNGGRWHGGIAGFADSATHVENCYSVGTVVRGYSWNWNPIIGHVDSGYAGAQNNYSLEGLDAGDTEASTMPSTIGTITSAEDFKALSMITKLGGEYVMDKSGGAAINNGYPVLLWQSGNNSVPEDKVITTGGVYSVTEGGTITIKTSEMVTLVGKGTGNDASNIISGLMITYDSDVSANLMIRDLYVKSTTNTNTINFNAAGNNLMLSGTNIIEGGSGGGGSMAVIHVPETADLNLSGTGTMYLFKETGGAGIGGNSSENNGKITFENGNYFIKGTKQGAVIGTGAGASKPGDITINGGNINIIGNARGASIGGAAGSSGTTEGGKVYVNGGTVSINVDFSGAAIGGGGYDGGNDSVGGELFVTGGSIRTYVDSNAISSWGLEEFGVNDKAINAAKLNNSTDKKAVALLTFDVTKLNKKSGAADPALFSVAEGSSTIYSGPLHTHKYVNQALGKTEQINVSYTPENWNADTDSNLYLYMTEENHSILVNDQTFNVKWDGATSKFTYEWAGTDVITKINAIGSVDASAECKAKIDAAREVYDKLTATDKTFVGNSSTLTTAEDTYAAKVVDKKITDIGQISGPSGLDKETDVTAARDAYNGLTPSQKQLVSKLSTLEASEAKITSLKADKAAADGVITDINDIGTPVTLESKAKIDIARAAYDKLTAGQKEFISTEQLKTLTDAEAEYDRLYAIEEKEKADKAAAKGVTDIIDTINTPVTLADKTAVENANTAYNALTDAQKAYITDENKTKLTNAVSGLKSLMVPVNAAAEKINQLPAVKNLTGSDKDMNEAILATAAYDGLSALEKSALPAGTADRLNAVKNKLAAINHTSEGVTVGGLDWTIRVVAEEKSSGDSFDAMKERADKKSKTLLGMYGIKLQKATVSDKAIIWQEYTLEGNKVKVNIVNDVFNNYGKAVAIHEIDENEYQELNAVISGNTASFEADSFSNYGIAGEKIVEPAAKTGDTFNVLPFIILLLIAAAGGTAVVLRKRHN